MTRTAPTRSFFSKAGFAAFVFSAAVGLAAAPVPAMAQEMMQLDTPKPEYTLGGFKYRPPMVDGWRQIANMQSSLSLVYAQSKGENTIETLFGLTMEAHDIPADTKVESAAALAELSRTQMAEARKPDLVGLSPIEAVPSIENLYTYRLLVHSPIQGDPDVYEVYYVMMAPDARQYVVIQCITKTQDYGNEIYFTQFYGSLSSLKYTAAKPADKPADAAKAPAAAEKAAPAGDAKPAAH